MVGSYKSALAVSRAFVEMQGNRLKRDAIPKDQNV
jgi:hypothetical protein